MNQLKQKVSVVDLEVINVAGVWPYSKAVNFFFDVMLMPDEQVKG